MKDEGEIVCSKPCECGNQKKKKKKKRGKYEMKQKRNIIKLKKREMFNFIGERLFLFFSLFPSLAAIKQT